MIERHRAFTTELILPNTPCYADISLQSGSWMHPLDTQCLASTLRNCESGKPELPSLQMGGIRRLGHPRENPQIPTDEHRCYWCGKQFTSAWNCKRHQLIHTGQKPFTCKFCRRSFNQKVSLRKHERLHSRNKLNSLGVHPTVPAGHNYGESTPENASDSI
ncbi:putative zinc finger and SCAN domain containing 2-like isoform X1 [Apostichopus japonicus]|uniref:Putative zinc finger and SCAN domain containing 2-like isoform X1 n=1 Tax=Stichopus japonicus TaxID=307972 RepID=A0A2G8L931_STIJA|nr:putative zinc finger and SCAN domain containing 2-like isoform X1 [Apostichopus japonicus]